MIILYIIFLINLTFYKFKEKQKYLYLNNIPFLYYY